MIPGDSVAGIAQIFCLLSTYLKVSFTYFEKNSVIF